MKYRLLWMVAGLLVAGFAVPAASGQLGIAVGLNFDSLGDVDTESTAASFDNATGYHIGLYYNLGAGPLSVRPGLFVRSLGDVEANVANAVEKFGLNIIEVPIDVRFRLGAAPFVKPYLLAGPVLNFARSDNKEFEETLENVSISAEVGAGLELSVPGLGLDLYPEILYSFGLSRFTKDGESLVIAGQGFQTLDTTTLAALMIRLGIGF